MQTFFIAASCAFELARKAATQASALVLVLFAVLMLPAVVAAESTTDFVSDDELLAEGLQSAVDDRPVVYLTFDDGPSADSVTEELLHVLARHNATATFFVTGQRVRQARDKIAEIVYAGHAIGNHTLSHAKLTEVSDKKALSELKVASEVILSAGGPPATCFRPPFGSTDQRVNSLAGQLGMVPVGWSIDTRDWERTTSIAEIHNALNRVTSESVVLLHDGPSYRGKMLSAFSYWMDTQAHRFQFRALPECNASGVVQMAQAQVPVSAPAVTSVARSEPVAPELVTAPVAEPASVTGNDIPAVASSALPPDQKVPTTIPELLAKIRAYRFELYDGGQQVDLTQVTATLDSEIHGDHIYYSF